MSIAIGDDYFPYSVALEVTLACNMRCLHCGSRAGTLRKNPLTIEEWFQVVDQLEELGTEFLTLSGGEPFVYKHTFELLEYMLSPKRKRPFKACVVTNGFQIPEEKIRQLKDLGLFHVGISLDGNKAVHDHIRQAPGSFASVMETVRLCRKYDLTCGLMTSFNQINFPVREEIKESVVKSGANNWQVQIVNTFGRAGEMQNQMLIARPDLKTLIDDMLRWQRELKGQVKVFTADSVGYCHPVMDELLEDTEWQGCNAGKYSLGIESDGSVKGCLSLQDPVFIEGNVRELSLKEIWNRPGAFAHTRGFDVDKLTGVCKGCDRGEDCKAGCLGMAYSIHQTVYENSYCYKAIVEKK